MRNYYFLLFILAFVTCKKDELKLYPIACFNLSPDTLLKKGDTVFFSNYSANSTSFNWDFGDGDSSTEIQPYHVYLNVGKYSIKLSAIRNSSIDTISKSIFVIDDTIINDIIIDDTIGCFDNYIPISKNSIWFGTGIDVDSIKTYSIDYPPYHLEKLLAYNYYRKYELLEDTIINHRIYTKLHFYEKRKLIINDFYLPVDPETETSKIIGFLREDHCRKKVYFLENGLKHESLLYDFSLQTGDTINSYICKDIKNSCIVYETYTSRIGDKDFPAYSVAIRDSFSTLIYFEFIEGVGCNRGIINLDLDPPYQFNGNNVY